MSTLDERYQKGTETRTRFGGGTIRDGSVPGAWQLAPDLQRIAGEALFGSIWHRPALTLEQREMSTLSVLACLQRENQLRRHTGNALNVGVTPDQIVEVFIHATFYAGFPAGLTALGIASDVFQERGISFTPQHLHNPSDSPDDLFNRGEERRREYMGDQPPRPAPVTQAEREFSRLTGEYYWGSLWTRPGLDLPTRSLCTLSALAALGREGPLRSHVRAALHVGLIQEEIVEIFIHVTFYAGLPFTRGAIDIANEVFRSG